MKFVNVMIIALMLVAGAAIADEKTMDTMNAVPNASSRGVFSGTLTENSPTYDRIYSGGLSLECASNVTDSSNNGVYMDIFCFNVADSSPIEMIMDPALTTIGDTYLTIYCDPFDVAAPELNVVFTDDDGGDGLLSAYTVEDGITLTPGNNYYLVVTTYSAGNTGDFSITTGANIMECGSVSVETVTWESLKANYR